jgi:phage-related protein
MAAGPQGWQIDDWRGAGGARPVKTFIDNLSKPAKGCAEHGNRLQLPHSRALEGGLQELRIAHPDGPVRVIYCYQPGRRIVLLHAFVKRTEAIRQSDLDVARTRKPAG